MNYFIDFEATQFSNEIISIGCVREDGETFYSLVAPSKGKITSFITNLTGITKEMLENALSPDKAFELLYDWAFVPDDTPEFYCWGDSDASFIQHTFKRMTSRKARMAAGYICGGVIDYHKKFCKKIGVKSCSLVKAYNFLLDSDYEQTHNALDDAMMLFKIYSTPKDTEQLKALVKSICSQSLKIAIPRAKNGKIFCNTGEKVFYFDSFGDAANWYIKNKVNSTSNPHKERIANRIKKACETDQKYGDIEWSYV